MEKIKLYIILSVGILTAVVIAVVLLNVFKADNNSRDFINSDDPLSSDQQTDNDSESQTPQSGEVAVAISDYTFGPAKVTVKKGSKVTWTNQDGVEHDISPDKTTTEFKKSELLGKGKSYSVTFNTVGTYTYHCGPHPYMKGTVEVVE